MNTRQKGYIYTQIAEIIDQIGETNGKIRGIDDQLCQKEVELANQELASDQRQEIERQVHQLKGEKDNLLMAVGTLESERSQLEALADQDDRENRCQASSRSDF
ncbi:unnamed protein product [Adineta ricciae]|uniref:Uncharacterized protein n=1 Tax=Adineta ricciae TaxID=249248 RepID=A0A815UB40_ADIRI|nr:unnamed protein product [Adineta ricciae]